MTNVHNLIRPINDETTPPLVIQTSLEEQLAELKEILLINRQLHVQNSAKLWEDLDRLATHIESMYAELLRLRGAVHRRSELAGGNSV